MEPYEFSPNDILHRIVAGPGCYLELYTVDSNDEYLPFIPPYENRYNQILLLRFGLNQETFEKIRNDQLASWKITAVTFYNAAFSIRHEVVYDKPVLKQPGVRTFHGVRAEQAYTETIPYDNITPNDFTLKIDMIGGHEQAETSWILSAFRDKLVFSTPANMIFDCARVHL